MLLPRLSGSCEVRDKQQQNDTMKPESKIRIQIETSFHDKCVFLFLPGTPPSPVPSLPERTPESFELATDQGDVTDRNPKLTFPPEVCFHLLLCFLTISLSSSRPGHVGGGRGQNLPRVALATCCFLKQRHKTFFEK